MVLESTVVCIDTSEYMRNGDYSPTRLIAEQDAISLIAKSKTNANVENNVGLVALTSGRMIVNLTDRLDKILALLHQVPIEGHIQFTVGLRVAHLALKHRQGKNHRMRIVAFVGSPLLEDVKELVKLAKRLKKEKVCVDVVSFSGSKSSEANQEKLEAFVETLNGKDSTTAAGSHLLTVPPGSGDIAQMLLSSPIVGGEDGGGGAGSAAVVAGGGAAAAGGGNEMGIDPSEDPELALALRVSMEEQRARQEAAAAAAGSAGQAGAVVETVPSECEYYQK